MVKIYGSMLCPDCVQCRKDLDAAGIGYEYCDFSDRLIYLKEFLRLRDTDPAFAEVRGAGKIGIPCILREDGTLTLDWEELLK